MSEARNVFAEKCLVGHWLFNPDAYSIEAVGIGPDAFTDTHMRAAFVAMSERAQEGQKWTMPVIAEALAQRCGVKSGVVSAVCDAQAEGAHDGETLVKINLDRLKELWAVRLAQRSRTELAAEWHPGMRASEMLEQSRETIGALEMVLHEDESADSRRTFEAMLLAIQSGKRHFGTKTGLARFDQSIGGLMPGHFYIIGARPSSGKTAAVITMATEAAKSGALVQFFSTETTREVLGARLASYQGDLDAFDIKKGQVVPGVFAADAARVPPMELYDDDCSITAIRSRVMKLAKACPTQPRVCIIDYIEELQAPKAGNREQEISKLVQALRKLAKEASCAMVVCSQLNRDAEGREPSKADLRMSGMLEQAADVILLLWVLKGAESEPVNIGMKLDKNKVGGILYYQDGLLYKKHSKVLEDDGQHAAPWDRSDWNG